MTMPLAILDRRSSEFRFGLVDELFRREPIFAGAGFAIAAMMLPTFAALVLDQRVLAGINLWTKPLKFEVALSVYLLSLAFFATFLPRALMQSRWYKTYAIIVVAAIAGELLWIGGAASVGVQSHFNNMSPLWTALFAFMGVSAVTLTSASLVFGVAIHRNQQTGLSPALKASLVHGLVLTFVLTLIVAGYMSSHESHLVGGNLSDTEAAPLFGWARDGGDLRVAHLFATHAMQAIPLFGMISAAVFGASNLTPVRLFSASYIALTFFTFVQAIMGLPFLPMIG